MSAEHRHRLTRRTQARLDDLGEWKLLYVSDPGICSQQRWWCGLREEDGSHHRALAATPSQAAERLILHLTQPDPPVRR